MEAAIGASYARCQEDVMRNRSFQAGVLSAGATVLLLWAASVAGVLLTNGDVARAQAAPQAPSSPVTVIRAGTLIDGVSESPKKNQLIFVRGERIEKVADAGAAI